MTRIFVAASIGSLGRTSRGPRLSALLASAAILPFLQGPTAAETVISTPITTPVATSTAADGSPDDVTISAEGSITLEAPGAALTLDSGHRLLNSGAIVIENLNDSTGILVLGGHAGSVENAGSIQLVEDYEPTDVDEDGDLDGDFAEGFRRYGLRVVGPQPFTGSIVNSGSGQINVVGNDSAGISIEARLQGDLVQAGGISVRGDRSVGVRADEVAGNVHLAGSIMAVGEDAAGVLLGAVEGAVVLQGAVGATGYRYVDRLPDEQRAKLDADDLRQGGPAVRIGGSVGGGVLLDRIDGDDEANPVIAILSSWGGAPALNIGAGHDIALGRVGQDEDAFGLVVKGLVQANGVNDGVAATGLRVGRPGGGRTTIENGLNVRLGSIEAVAYGADATAIHLEAGAEVAELHNSGGNISALTDTGGAHAATALLIEAGAVAAALHNHGRLAGSAVGTGDATAVVDRSGGLSLVENTGVIEATVAPREGNAAGRTTALDLRANTSGVLIHQWSPEGATQGPTLQGDVLLGSGDDRVKVAGGTLTGTLSFGAGADVLEISGGARVSGGLATDDGRLAIEIADGRLEIGQTGVLALTSLDVGPQGALTVTIDPRAGTATRLEASGAVSIDAGAEIGVSLRSLFDEPQSFEIIRAGALRAENAGAALIGAPYLYSASLRADEAAGRLHADLRLRTTEEMGLRRSQAQAFDAVFAAMDRDEAIGAAFLSKLARQEFVALYDQFLPDHSGGALASIVAFSNAVSFAARQKGAVGATPGQAQVWAHEIFLSLDHDRRDAQGFDVRGFGLAGGVEQTTANGAAYGLTLSFASSEHSDKPAAVGERVVMNLAGGSIYVRKELGGLVADVRAGGGVAFMDSRRRLVSEPDGLDLTAEGRWLGWLAEAHLGLAYELRLGPLYLRPRADADYVRLREQGYEEKGGGAGVDLEIDDRRSSLLTGAATLSVGLEFGDSFRWGPELTVGRRELFSGGAGRTTARFLDGGERFVLDPETPVRSTTILRGGLKGSALGALVALEGGVEAGGPFRQWDLRGMARFAF